MKNVAFNAASESLAVACFNVFEELYAIGKDLPEGKALVPNGTGYFDRTVDMFVDATKERHLFYRTVDPETGRRVLICPVQNFSSVHFGGLKGMRVAGDSGKSLVFFERYSGGKSPVIVEQLSNSHNVDCIKTFALADLLWSVGDWLV